MSLWSQKFPPYGAEVAKYPYSPQSDANAYSQGASGNAIEMFSPDQLPVKTALAKAFGVHNKLFTSVPSASSPVRINSTPSACLFDRTTADSALADRWCVRFCC